MSGHWTGSPIQLPASILGTYDAAVFRGHIRLVGQLLRNTERFDARQPGILITGSWLTVKEQMPEVYALRFAERGYAAFTFDFSGFGQSGGEPRQAEMPHRKIADIIAATEFLSTLSLVEPDTLTALCRLRQLAVRPCCPRSGIAREAIRQRRVLRQWSTRSGAFVDERDGDDVVVLIGTDPPAAAECRAVPRW